MKISHGLFELTMSSIYQIQNTRCNTWVFFHFHLTIHEIHETHSFLFEAIKKKSKNTSAELSEFNTNEKKYSIDQVKLVEYSL